MKTHRVVKVCNTARLHEELETAGVPVATIRGQCADRGEPAMLAVVVVEDSADMAKVREVVEAHSETQRPSWTLSAKDQEQALTQMEKV